VAVGLYRFVDGEDCPARSTYLRNRRNGSRKAGSDAILATFRRSANIRAAVRVHGRRISGLGDLGPAIRGRLAISLRVRVLLQLASCSG
jgi:hypothetical protein